MKKRYHHIYALLLSMLVLPSSLSAQEATNESKQDSIETVEKERAQAQKEAARYNSKRAKAQAKADAKYSHFAYINAIELYEKMANEGYKSQEVLEKIGNSYYYNADLIKAKKWYAELFDIIAEDSIAPEVYYRYSQTLKATGDYKTANKYLDKFNVKKETDTRGQKYASHKNYLETIKANSGRYKVAPATAINSEYSDYGATTYNGYVIFTSARDTGGIFKRRHSWTNQSFTNLYTAKQAEDGTLSEAQPFIKHVKGKFHESTPVVTRDGKTIYFTRNNVDKGKKGIGKDDTRKLKIYKATLKDGKWQNAQPLPFNSNDYNCAHPALNKDETILYFASDMPGTIGESDIYQVSIANNGTKVGKPENLGEVINTEGKETFPYVTINNELYFSSDGHPGLGGLDIYGTRKERDSTYHKVHNVGTPVNSEQDDFAYIIDFRTKHGYFSSNREGGKGYDDIYNLLETKSLFQCKQLLKGTITDQETGEIIAGAKLTLYDLDFKSLATVTTDEKGKYELEQVKCDSRYYVRVEKEDYHTQEQYVSLPYERGETIKDIALEPELQQLGVGDDIFIKLKMKPINFDLNKSNIRPDAAIELDKVVAVLREYPTMKIDVRSHTDSRGSDKYNEKLSGRRAASTMKYITDQEGVSKHRVTSQGYGESKLLNHCKNGVKCSDEEHEENRRSEFIVVEM